ncbi:O-antigen ligase family protein [Salinarchaeum sp. IM2453]|uniref:O-antigen ligase family protein n=1 Tax=Salinarchaeum sp. IM2453 TaxID=2862870 RepID=UPI001C82836C|nr:O-antigen ligase family protein [Salinarchaeum sp. IM2453]QZA89079.1 O-antigen ligase family protein [Salinarchaeum sp. IM2453]
MEVYETRKAILGDYTVSSVMKGSPNQLAQVLFFSTLGSLHIFFNIDKKRGLILLLFTGFGLLVTVGRSAIGGVIISAVIYLLYLLPTGILLKIGLYSFPVVFLSIIFLLFTSMEILERAIPIDFTGRFTVWESILQANENSRLIGNGLKDQYLIIEKHHPENQGYSAHSAYMSIYLSTGILGLMIYILFILYVYLQHLLSENDPFLISIAIGTLVWHFVGGNWIVGNEWDAVILLIIFGMMISGKSNKMIASQVSHRN